MRYYLGATPAATVASVISISLKKDGDDTPFARAQRGYYSLKENLLEPSQIPAREEETDQSHETSLINALGMCWRREVVA